MLRMLVVGFLIAVASCGSDVTHSIGEVCGNGTERGFDCGRGFCLSGSCGSSGPSQFFFTCSEFCGSDADCEALQPGAICVDTGHCLLACQDDDDCESDTECNGGVCVRIDPPDFTCPR